MSCYVMCTMDTILLEKKNNATYICIAPFRQSHSMVHDIAILSKVAVCMICISIQRKLCELSECLLVCVCDVPFL